MIIGLTGTGKPFPRLIKALANYAQSHPAEEVWVQYGSAEIPGPLRGQPIVPRAKLAERLRDADVVVTHAGGGSLMDVMRAGHVPVVVPRLKKYGEHINDHQLELFQALADAGRIIPLHSVDDLETAICKARDAKGRSARNESTHDSLRSAVVREAHMRVAGVAKRRRQVVWNILSWSTLLLWKLGVRSTGVSESFWMRWQ